MDFKIPKTPGACADRLLELKDQMAGLTRQHGVLEEEFKALKEHLIQTLPKDDARGVLGRSAKAIVVVKDVPSVKDWDALYKHVLKTKDFSLMQRRLADGAVRERWDDGKKVPGVEPFKAVTVSVTKI